MAPGGFYVFDRVDIDYDLFEELHRLPCRFVARLQARAAYEVAQPRPVSQAAQAAGVLTDCVLRRLSTEHHRPLLSHPLRLVHVASGMTRPDGAPDVLVLVTNCLALDAELVALAYRYRWSGELFFCWLKCVLGCCHLLSQSPNGVQLQVYLALIASSVISLWVGRPPHQTHL